MKNPCEISAREIIRERFVSGIFDACAFLRIDRSAEKDRRDTCRLSPVNVSRHATTATPEASISAGFHSRFRSHDFSIRIADRARPNFRIPRYVSDNYVFLLLLLLPPCCSFVFWQSNLSFDLSPLGRGRRRRRFKKNNKRNFLRDELKGTIFFLLPLGFSLDQLFFLQI